MFQMSRLERLWLALFLALSASANPAPALDGASSPPQKPTTATIQTWVTKLGSTDFQTREEALASLIEAGKPAIAPLARAVMSSDPEVAWRAATALETIGLFGDEATLAEIKIRMEKTKGTPHRDLAAVLATLSQRWGEMQRVKAQTALVKLGATFPSPGSGMPMPYATPPSGFIGSYASLPVFSSGTVVLDSFSVAPPAIMTAPPKVEFDPLTLPSSIIEVTEIIEDLKATDEKKVDDEEADDKKIDDQKDDKTKTDAASPKEAPKRAEKESEKKTDEVKSAADKAAPTSDSKETSDAKPDSSTTETEVDEPAAPSTTVVGSDIVLLTSDSLTESSATAPAMSFAFGEIPGAPTAAMFPTSVGLDKEWRGGDEGLAYLAALGNVNSLDIQDAAITDKAIEHFKKIPGLSSILIRGTKISPAALIKLSKEKPGLVIRGQSRGILGITSGDPTGACIVSTVTDGAPAAEVGIQPGDIIVKIDGKPIETFGQLTIWMMKKEPGADVKITLKRGDETLEKKLKLGNRESIIR